MAGYYNKNHLFGISHSRIARYEILWKIIQERLEKNGKCETQGKPENGGVSEKLEQYRDLLMTDLYLREKCKEPPNLCKRFKRLQGLCPRIFPEGREDTRAFIWLRRLRFQANGKMATWNH